MSQAETPNDFGLSTASQLVEASDHEWPVIFEHLRKSHKLSDAIHQMNALLRDPQHEAVVSAALRRIGLEYVW